MKWRTSRAENPGRSRRLVPVSGKLGLLLLALTLAGGGVAWAGLSGESAPPAEPVQSSTAIELQATSEPPLPAPVAPPAAEPPAERAVAQPAVDSVAPAVPKSALLFFAARSEGGSQLFAQPEGTTARYPLTAGDWDDRDPAVSPEGSRLAFASNRGGTWDLYLMELANGNVQRLTDTPGYEGRPTWSPDGLWLAYEAYYGDDLDIWVLPVDGSQGAIQLTDDPASDMAPSWDPQGRRIAFISDRAGQPDLYLADLDNSVDRFINLTQTSEVSESDPAFDPTGRWIAYSTWEHGLQQVWKVEASEPVSVTWIGQGGRPSWDPAGAAITAILNVPTRAHVVSYGLSSDPPLFGVSVSGQLEGMSWTDRAAVPGWASAQQPASAEPTGTLGEQGARLGLITLPGVSPEGLALSQAAYDAFVALRNRAGSELGWDFLAQLDMAFVDLNDPLPPGYGYNDWLHTGRAFAFSQAAYQAGWVEVVREDFGAQTYWRIFVRAAAQDGSLGEPLRAHPWDFDSRYSGNPALYDQGGNPKPAIPPGYYVDFTSLAAGFGFERLPALSHWRTYYPAARFNEFALIDGTDWLQAMLQLYPPEAIATPTAFQTPTQTPTNTPRPTPTPWWWRWRTPTFAPTLAPTGTPTPGAAP